MGSKEAMVYLEKLVLSRYTESETIPNITQRYYHYGDMLNSFDAGAESEKKKVEWHSLAENPNDIPPTQEYETKDSIDNWKWYLVKTDYTDYESCHYAICARVLIPRYSDGVEEPMWVENSGMSIADDRIFAWRELDE